MDEINDREDEVLGVIREIVNLASDGKGEYIYRGQSNDAHRAVTSTLYRAMQDAIKNGMKNAMQDAIKDEITDEMKGAMKDAMKNAMKNGMKGVMKGVMEDAREDAMKGAMENAVKDAMKDVVEEVVKDAIEDAEKDRGGEIESADWLDMNEVQKEELEAARRFERKFKDKDDDNIEMLSRIQHYSGDTNLIDFTKDCYVALFFACYHKYDVKDGADGKVFLVKESDLKRKGIEIVIPVHPPNRVTAQKSVFIQPPQGVISADIIKSVRIPLDLKRSILKYLEAYHNISLSNIYNDLHGYIRHRKAPGNVVMEFYLGLYYSYKNNSAKSPEEKRYTSEEAIKHYNKVIHLDPKHVNTYNNRGLVKSNQGDYEGAIRDCNESIALNPENALTFYSRGVNKAMLGDNNGAISDYDKAIKLNSKYAAAYNNRGIIKRKLGDMAGAISDYDKGIALNPDYVKAYHNRGNTKMDFGDIKWKLDDELGAIRDYKDAVSDYDKAIALDPNCVAAYNNRGIVKKNLGGANQKSGNELGAIRDYKDAINDYDKAIELDPKNSSAYFNRVIAKKKLNDM